MSAFFRLYFVCIFERFSGHFFLKPSQNKLQREKDPCAAPGCNNDRLFLVRNDSDGEVQTPF